MIRAADMATVLAGAVLLGAMMASAPDYNSVFQPFPAHAAPGEAADGRLFDARFLGGRLAQQVAFERYGTPITRDSAGLFLIADFEVSNVTASTRIAATWRGASGRDYAATGRVEGAPGGLEARWFQPGLTDRAFAVFELPEDEVPGGRLVLTAPGVTILDSALDLQAPPLPGPQPLARIAP